MGTETTVPTDWMGNPIGEPTTYATTDGSTDMADVPDGTIQTVLAWVGYDPDRAKAALLHEHSADHPRRGLLDALERLTKE